MFIYTYRSEIRLQEEEVCDPSAGRTRIQAGGLVGYDDRNKAIL